MLYFKDTSDMLQNMSDMLAKFTVPNSSVTPTQTPVAQTHVRQMPVMRTHGDVNVSMEVDDSGMPAGADVGISATPAAGAEPSGVAVETHVVSEAPFSKLDSIPLRTIDRPPMRFRRAPYTCNPMAQSCYGCLLQTQKEHSLECPSL